MKSLTITILLFGSSLLFNAQTIGGFLSFDGQSISTTITSTGDQVKIADDASLDFNSTDFTLEFWIKPNFTFVNGSTGIEGIITKKSSGSSSSKGYAVYWESTVSLHRIRFNLGDGNQRTLSSKNNSNINSNSWMHIAAVFNKTIKDSAFLYIDGELVDKNIVSNITDMSNSYPLTLMAFKKSTQDAGGGFMDDIRMWKKALSQDQIQKLRLEPIEKTGVNDVKGSVSQRMISGIGWNELVMYFKAEEGSGTQLTDLSSFGNHGTLYEGNQVGNGPQWVAYNTTSTRPVFQSTASGDWSNPAAWNRSSVPNDPNAIVFVKSGDIKAVNNGLGTYEAGDLIICSNRSLTFNLAASLNIHGNLEVIGNLNPQKGQIDFVGNRDQSIEGTGLINFFNLGLNKIGGHLSIKENTSVYGVLDLEKGNLNTGSILTLKDNVTNSSHPSALANGGALCNVIGKLKIEKRLANANSGWRHMSLPLGGTVNDFSGLTLYTLSEPQASKRNIYHWDNSENNNSGECLGWAPSSFTDDQSQAYVIYLDNSTFSFNNPFSFEGELNVGDLPFPMTHFNDPGNSVSFGQVGYDNGVGWNFIPNPFPSLLGISDMIADSDFQSKLAYRGVHIWDALSEQYIAFIANGVAANVVPYNNQQIQSGTYTTIRPFEGFWLKTSTALETSVVIKDSWRKSDYSSLPYPTMKTVNLARLNVINVADNSWSQAVVNFENAATKGFDPSWDAYLLKGNPDKPSLYTMADQRYLSINSIPGQETDLPLYFEPSSGSSNAYQLQLDDSELGAEWRVNVFDRYLNKWHNLTSSNYNFSATPNADLYRFDVFFSKSAIAIEELESRDESFCFQKGRKAFLKLDSRRSIFSIQVQNLSGIVIENVQVENREVIDLNIDESGMYIVQIRSDIGLQSIKFVFK